jgi:hypothetical protein
MRTRLFIIFDQRVNLLEGSHPLLSTSDASYVIQIFTEETPTSSRIRCEDK